MDASLADLWLGNWLATVAHTRRWQVRLEAVLGTHHMGLNELLVLRQLREVPEPGLTQIELVRRLVISPALMSGMMESLQARQWIHSVRSPHDRRRVFCSLTPSGQMHYETVLRDLTQLADLLPPISNSQNTNVREVAA